MKFTHVFFLIVLGTITNAFRIDIYGQRNALATESRISRRADITGTQLNNSADISYYANLLLGGKTFHLLVDTGSSDLWVAGDVPNTNDTNLTASIHYAVGSVQGPVKTARLDFDGQIVLDQAFMEVTPDLDNKDGSGILGLGPNSGSNIYATVGTVTGAAVVDRIFLQNQTTPNYVTVLLGRSEDPTDPYPGSITVGDVLSGFENVMNQPKLPVTIVAEQKQADQHFQVLLDEDGLIGPDGQPIPLHTNVSTTSNQNQATVVVDTGFSLPQLPMDVVEAIYNRFQGAELTTIDTVGQVWIIPCTQEVNITFKFAGQLYPIHPLDATLDPATIGMSNITNSQGQVSCIGAFQPVSFDIGSAPSYDMVLGMSFLRNVYMVMNYGDFIVGTTDRADPYIQFLSTTDPAEAHTDFVKVRLNGIDTTTNEGVTNSNGNSSPSIRSTIAGVISVVVVVVLAVVAFIIYRKKHQTRQRIVDNAGSPLAVYPPPQIMRYGPPTSPLPYKMSTTISYDPRQRHHKPESYIPDGFQSPQYYSHQPQRPRHKKR